MPEKPTNQDRASDFVVTTIIFTLGNYFILKRDFTRSLLVAALAALFLTFFRQTIKDWIKKGLRRSKS